MLHIDAQWLTSLQYELGLSENQGFRAFSTTANWQPELYVGLERLYVTLIDEIADSLKKQSAVIQFLNDAHDWLNPAPVQVAESNHKLVRAAEYIRAHCTQSLSLTEICMASQLSASYLIRAFKACYGMTPHAYQINYRIEFCRARLKHGRPIAASQHRLHSVRSCLVKQG